jgi:hypothetical protein
MRASVQSEVTEMQHGKHITASISLQAYHCCSQRLKLAVKRVLIA